jgi:hypothetical protein
MIVTWRVMSGWLRFLNKVSLTAGIILTGLATIPQFAEGINLKLGVAAMICESIALFSKEMYQFAETTVQERKSDLVEMEKDLEVGCPQQEMTRSQSISAIEICMVNEDI